MSVLFWSNSSIRFEYVSRFLGWALGVLCSRSLKWSFWVFTWIYLLSHFFFQIPALSNPFFRSLKCFEKKVVLLWQWVWAINCLSKSLLALLRSISFCFSSKIWQQYAHSFEDMLVTKYVNTLNKRPHSRLDSLIQF